MNKALWRIVLLTVFAAVCIMMLSGCYFGDFWDPMDEPEPYFTDMRECVSEGYFKLTIDTNKNEFARGEAIDCWAELEYIGENDSITVYIYDNLINMDMSGEGVIYNSWNFSSKQEPLTLQKGVPFRYTLAESVPKSSSILPGRYQIEAYVNISLSPDDAVTYNRWVSAVIIVHE